MNYLNQELNYGFNFDSFLIFCIRIDCDALAEMQMNLKEIHRKYVFPAIMRIAEKDICRMAEISEEDCFTGILNFDQQYKQIISHKFYHLIYDLKNLLGVEKVHIVISHGGIIHSASRFMQAFTDAKAALYQRIYAGTDRIIVYHAKDPQAFLEQVYPKSFCEDVMSAVREENGKRINQLFCRLKENIQKQKLEDGYFLWLAAIDWGKFFLNNTVKVRTQLDVYEEEKKYRKELLGCYNPKMVFKCMENKAQYIMDQFEKRRQMKDLKPIHLAKVYIEENYAKPITLEEISAFVGLSHAYLSGLFKKETGRNFTEYLSVIRVEKAKDLLKDSDRTVADIAARVGYIDDKYFSRVFKKYTSLTPGEYRQLYYSVRKKKK